MAWTAPRTWSTGELVTAAMMNVHVRDNLLALKSPPGGQALISSDVSTTSTTYVDITGASLTVTTTGGAILLEFNATMYADVAGRVVNIRVVIGSNITATLITQVLGTSSNPEVIHVTYRLVPTAGSNQCRVQWLTNAGTITLPGASVVGVLIATEST